MLGQQLVVPGQWQVPHVEGLPAPHVPPAVIPATRRSNAEVAASTTSPLDSAEWVYVRQGSTGPPLADSYQGPFHVLEEDGYLSMCSCRSGWTASQGTV